ncbi:hypothetical protein CC79DRAFT_190961 [Sarocladium strictum]
MISLTTLKTTSLVQTLQPAATAVLPLRTVRVSLANPVLPMATKAQMARCPVAETEALLQKTLINPRPSQRVETALAILTSPTLFLSLVVPSRRCLLSWLPSSASFLLCYFD